MKARQRLHTRTRQMTPPDYPAASLHQAIWSGTRCDTLYAKANYHARQGNGLIAKRLREVAAALMVA